MEKPEPAQVSPAPLTILHHDEHLVFPGYDLMVGKGSRARDEESGMTSSTARNDGDEAELPIEGQSSLDVICLLLDLSSTASISPVPSRQISSLRVFYLFDMVQSSSLLALAGLVAYISARPSLGPRAEASFEGIATFNDYSFQLETQGSTVCGGTLWMEIAHQMPKLTQVQPALMPGAVRQPATRLKTSVPLGQPKEKSSAAPPYRSLTDVQLAVRGTTGKRPKAALRSKTQYEPEARCSSPTTEALDLDFNAYSTLYPGKSYSSGNPEGNPNLKIRITPTSC
ncbi:MAG: hypothetical protein Q9172_003642 [Xanthocarpia lactea]